MSETATALEKFLEGLLRRITPEEMQDFKAELKAHLDKHAKCDYRLPIDNVCDGTQGDKDEVGLDTKASSRSGRHCTEHPRNAGAGRDWHFGASCTSTVFDCSGGGY